MLIAEVSEELEELSSQKKEYPLKQIEIKDSVFDIKISQNSSFFTKEEKVDRITDQIMKTILAEFAETK